MAGGLMRPMRENLQEILEDPSLPWEWYEALEEAGTQFLVWAWLKGQEHVLRQAPPDQRPETFADFPIDFEPIPFTEAIEELKRRVPIEPEVFNRMESALRFRAFTAARLAGKDALARLQDIMASGLQEGEGLSGFLNRVGKDELLQQSGFAEANPYYLENVYRTNASAAYNAGRRRKVQEMGGVEMLEYVAIIDRRTTDICRNLDGVRRPPDDPIWDRITPPNHFNERATVRSVFTGTSEAQAAELTPEDEVAGRLDETPLEEGFESAPLTAEEMATLPDDVRERARGYGILGTINGRKPDL